MNKHQRDVLPFYISREIMPKLSHLFPGQCSCKLTFFRDRSFSTKEDIRYLDNIFPHWESMKTVYNCDSTTFLLRTRYLQILKFHERNFRRELSHFRLPKSKMYTSCRTHSKHSRNNCIVISSCTNVCHFL